jgi:hypothetical protein
LPTGQQNESYLNKGLKIVKKPPQGRFFVVQKCHKGEGVDSFFASCILILTSTAGL